ncbi:MAG: hypothetical protein ACFFB5_20550 [Promethearchaeota archaeon]
MLSKKVFIFTVLGVMTCSIIFAYIVITLMNPNDNTNNTEIVNSNNSSPDPSELGFLERWNFTASLDRTIYTIGINMTLTVQLTCLTDHNVTNYNPGWFRWVAICNSSDIVVWHPFRERPEICYPVYEFHKGDELGGIHIIHLGTTREMPTNSTFEVNHWIPVLPPDKYHFLLDSLPTGICLTFSSDDVSPIQLPFEIIVV